MFNQTLSRRERWWLLALRLVWQYRSHRRDVIRLIDRLTAQAGFEPCGAHWVALFAALESAGADHLYIERFDKRGITGDERDLLEALRACWLDDALEAEHALSALVPPGTGHDVLAVMRRIAGRAPARLLGGHQDPSTALPAHEFVH